LVLVPALAVDHSGVRLGKGGGYYDRALSLSTGPVVAVVRDEEFVPSLPAEPHDVRVDAVLTPGRGVVRLPLL
jgi:5-formyltetrahydrofolate cyclo-ligase